MEVLFGFFVRKVVVIMDICFYVDDRFNVFFFYVCIKINCFKYVFMISYVYVFYV